MFDRGAIVSALLLSVLTGFTHCAAVERTVEIPTKIQAPAGTKLLYKAKATGKQIYVGVKTANGFEWKLEAPSAQLIVGKENWTHGKGPTWQAEDGSQVKKIDGKEAITSEPAPNAKADIPWLLIRVTPDGDKTGKLSAICFVQRINTKGGHPPVRPPVKVGERVEVDYTAEYYFYGVE